MVRKINKKINRKRIYFLFFLFVISFAFIVYKLVLVQYIFAEDYKTKAECQHIEEFIVNSKRGKILDGNGIELATSLIEKTVYANPYYVEDPERDARTLSKILDLEYKDVRDKLENKDLGFVYLKRQISSETADLISELELKGIYVQNENKRYYPQDDLAASVIGFTGLDNNGLSGIELEYEKILRGVDGKYIIERDVSGKIIPGTNNDYITPVDGGDITLTIDSQIQLITQKKLEEVVKNYNALRAIAVVMNPNSGDIYAIAEYPGFDLNNYQDYDQEKYKNMGVSYTYEPGSTFKIINIASAIDNNTIGVEQSFNLPPRIQVGDKVIEEIFRTYNQVFTTGEIIKYSSNIGAVVSALSMGKQLFYESIKKFGFGQLTGINIPGEEAGLFYNYKNWSSSTIGALAIGQSISVTPLQLIRAACVLANDGYLVTPNIIKQISLSDEKIEYPETKEKKRIISSETSQALKDMMFECVEDGTGEKAKIEGIKICGKTGTAQKANKSGKGYTEGRVITSFVGFGPYENPEVAIIVVVDEPQKAEDEVWGGTVAAPVFRELMDFSLKKLRIIE